MCISQNAAMIPKLKYGKPEKPKNKKKILKPVKVNEKTLTVLELLSTFVNIKPEPGLEVVSVGTKAFISILKHAKNCR